VELKAGVPQLVLEANGIRSQVVALVVEAAELFCLNLKRYIDIDSLQMLAQPATIQASHYLGNPDEGPSRR
jgi:hypothetical protein